MKTTRWLGFEAEPPSSVKRGERARAVGVRDRGYDSEGLDMATGNGLAIFLGIEHLDAASRTLIDRNGAGVHRALPVSEAVTGPVSDAMLRLAGPELGLDPDVVDRAA